VKSVNLVIFLSLLVSCGNSNESVNTDVVHSSKIYGGDKVENGKWPSVVAFAKVKSSGELKESFCTGTLIDTNTILTAAHCFSRNPVYYKRSTVVSRDDVGTENPRTRKIENILIHPKYIGKDSPFDFALVKVEKAFEISNDEIVTPSKKINFSPKAKVQLVGFGKRENGESGVKFEAKTFIRENQELEFIAGGKGKDTCSGDSGGPVFQKSKDEKFEFIGVTSRTPDDASIFCGDKTLYGKVSVGMKWVEAESLIARAVELSNRTSIQLLEKSLKVYPKYFKAYVELGKVYLKFQEIEKALSNFLKASIINLKSIESLDNLAKIYRIQKDQVSEKNTLTRLIVLSPNDHQYFDRLVELGDKERAEVSRGLGRFQMGELHLAKLDLEFYPLNSQATFALAFLYFKMGELEKSLKTLKTLKNGAPIAVNMTDRRGDTFLLVSVFEGHLEVIKELMKFSPDLRVRDNFGNSLTEAAWWSKKFAVIDYLMEQGVAWDANNYFEQFLSMVKHENMEVVRFLLRKGIDTTLIGPNGVTAQFLANETQNQVLIDLIKSYTAEK